MMDVGYNDTILKRLQIFGLYNEMESKKITQRPIKSINFLH
jgi:hypothetical protein